MGTDSGAVEAAKKERDDYTFGEVEAILLNYLNENDLNYEVGSKELREIKIKS